MTAFCILQLDIVMCHHSIVLQYIVYCTITVSWYYCYRGPCIAYCIVSYPVIPTPSGHPTKSNRATSHPETTAIYFHFNNLWKSLFTSCWTLAAGICSHSATRATRRSKTGAGHKRQIQLKSKRVLFWKWQTKHIYGATLSLLTTKWAIFEGRSQVISWLITCSDALSRK